MIAEHFNKNLRCKFCPDQLSDFADISLEILIIRNIQIDAEGGSFYHNANDQRIRDYEKKSKKK